MEDEYQLFINYSLTNAEKGKSKINQEIINLDGMCGIKARHLYNNLINYGNELRYLEIGSWKGSSICSALFDNKNNNVLCIDNWNVVGGKEDFLKNLEKFKGNNEVSYIDTDYLNNVPEINSKFNIYVYDGDYLKDCNYKALVKYYNYLDDIFIYIKNDWNEEYVREETEEAIRKLKLNYIYKKEIIVEKSLENWWNGMCIFILRK